MADWDERTDEEPEMEDEEEYEDEEEKDIYELADDYQGYAFAISSWEWTLLSFEPELQKAAYKRLLKRLGIDEERVVRILEAGERNGGSSYWDPEDEAMEAVAGLSFGEYKESEICDLFELLGCAVEDGKVVLEAIGFDGGGSETMDLLDALGWGFDYAEGDGVYYIGSYRDEEE